MTEVYDQARLRLEDADVAPEEASALIVFLSELAAEKLPGTRDEDPLQLYLEAAERHMQECLEVRSDCATTSWSGSHLKATKALFGMADYYVTCLAPWHIQRTKFDAIF